MATQKKFVNPFDKGVTYKDFLASVPKGITVEKHCKGKLTDSEIVWLSNDIKHLKK